MQHALSKISVADYLDGELRSPVRHEYIDGEVFAMSGSSRRHNLIVGNLFTAARTGARGRGCQVFANDMKVFIAARNIFYYPDVSCCCDPLDREDYFLTRPCFVVEVLSPSTAAIDRREKRLNYATLDSLREYVLVNQDQRRVDVYRRGADGAWSAEKIEGHGTLQLNCVSLSLSLDDIYEDVELPPFVAEEAPPEYA